MDTNNVEIQEINAPAYLKCYIDLEGHWRVSRVAVPMIQADLALMIEPLPENLFRIYFKKDVAHVVKQILKGNY